MKTAVEWFVIELKKLNIEVTLEIEKKSVALFEQAKEIEKEHHKKTFNESRLTHPLIGFKHQSFNDYYNETFKSE
jgi:hypothetical protein